MISKAAYTANFQVEIPGCPHGRYSADLGTQAAGAPFPTNGTSPFPCDLNADEDTCEDIVISTVLPAGVNEFNTSFIVTGTTRPPNVQ